MTPPTPNAGVIRGSIGSALSVATSVAVGAGLSDMIEVADAPVVVMGEVTSPRSDSEVDCVSSLLDVLEADLVMVGV